MLLERSTRLVLLCKMPNAMAESALGAFTAKLNQVVQPMRQTLTYDQGKEMSCNRELWTQTLGKSRNPCSMAVWKNLRQRT